MYGVFFSGVYIFVKLVELYLPKLVIYVLNDIFLRAKSKQVVFSLLLVSLIYFLNIFGFIFIVYGLLKASDVVISNFNI